jgi:hypothetical protein
VRLISVVSTAIAAAVAAASAISATITAATAAAAVAAAAAISTTAKRLVFLRLGFIYLDSTAFYRSTVQLGDSLAGSFIIRHFYETESTGPAGYFVHDYLGGSHFAIRRKKFPEIFILNGEAQICNINVHTKT